MRNLKSQLLVVRHLLRVKVDLVNALLPRPNAIRNEVITDHQTLLALGTSELKSAAENLGIRFVHPHLVTAEQQIKKWLETAFGKFDVLTFVKTIGYDM